MKKVKVCAFIIPLLILAFCFNASAQTIDKFYGSWQGRTYGATMYDPMPTFKIDPKGVWTDLTFGQAKAVKAKYVFDAKQKVLTLYSAKGNKLYSFKLVPATADEKERLVEQLPQNETYKALVCYHYKF